MAIVSRSRARRVGLGIALGIVASCTSTSCDDADVVDCDATPSAPACRTESGVDSAPPETGPDARCDETPGLPMCSDECQRVPDAPACRDAAGADLGAEDDASAIDAGPDDGGAVDDLGTDDAGPMDAGPMDAGAMDTGPIDAGPMDAGTDDLGSTEGGPTTCPTGVPCRCTPDTTLGCAPTNHCVLIYGTEGDGGPAGTRCVERGMTIAGFACDRESPRCLSGFQCAHNWMGDVVCLNLCETDRDCGLGLFCYPEPTVGWAHAEGRAYGVCLPRP